MTAATIGFVGGQFGLDRIVLTGFTISMINEICDELSVTENKARGIHIVSAIARLTVKGTAMAHTLLNWIPGGSLVNGYVTFVLTKKAGDECIEDILKNRMTTGQQARQAVNRGLTHFANREISHFVGHITDTSFDALGHFSEPLAELLKDSAVDEYGRIFISTLLTKTTEDMVQGRRLNLAEEVRTAVYGVLAVALLDHRIHVDDSYVPDREARIEAAKLLEQRNPAFKAFLEERIKIIASTPDKATHLRETRKIAEILSKEIKHILNKKSSK
ncbi:hypothetical protein [Geminocystis sp. GBBB08]|uniref:hypothetical protein n=1 Tax=Geminocystis sp. GBBB08 TaxID=2604140 RepID=UPI0027E34642|nr:hypothetical protein [Geminocystis sp. GBBB08]MBL1208248.1 hypothetical protein [Geminocystis sp. GBBB08]